MNRALLAFILSLSSLLAFAPPADPAHDTATFDVSITADLELIPHAIGTNYGVLTSDRGVIPEPPLDAEGVSFSFDGSASAIPIASSVFVGLDSHGEASWSGTGPRADASGRVLAGGELGLVTALPIDQTITLLTTVRACRLMGDVDSDVAEAAAGYVQVWLGGDPVFDLPGNDEIFYLVFSTRDPPGGDSFGESFDVNCLTFIDSRDIVLPGYSDPVAFEVFPVHLTVSAGGRAVSLLSDSGALVQLVITPEDLTPPHEMPTLALAADERIAAILASFDNSVANGSLVGAGPGKSAAHRLGALRNMLSDASALIGDGRVLEASDQLFDALARIDGLSPPEDFVIGPAADDLAFDIKDLRTSLDTGAEQVEPDRQPNG